MLSDPHKKILGKWPKSNNSEQNVLNTYGPQYRTPQEIEFYSTYTILFYMYNYILQLHKMVI